jgi:hypothetical protein
MRTSMHPSLTKMRGRMRPTNRMSTAKCFAIHSGVLQRLIRSTRPAVWFDVDEQPFNGELIMRPIRSILDASFCYVPSVATSVASTWRRAGWRPTTDAERRARRQPTAELVVDWVGAADAPTTVARRIAVRVSSKSRGPLPARDFERGADTQSGVAPIRKFHPERESASSSAGRLRDGATLRWSATERDDDMPIERRKTQSADRNVQDARSGSAYCDAIVSPL